MLKLEMLYKKSKIRIWIKLCFQSILALSGYKIGNINKN